MANTVPASLKTADIARFAHRAAQLEKPKPAVAYWCNYWILNQILAKNLHNVDSEALTYTTGLMDKVEQFKNANSTNDAVVDDVAGKAYIEQFGLETFGKADNSVRADKVTVGTADTFQAAATFLELLAIWGPLEPEITAKVKYAKFHAVRILKAIKAGEDPNLSNPKPEPETEEALPKLDPNDAEVRAIEGVAPKPRQASVVEVPDEADRLQERLARVSSLDESLHPSREQSTTRPPRPSVVQIPDEADRLQAKLAKTSSLDESLHPSRDQSTTRPPRPSVVEVPDEAHRIQNNLAKVSSKNESLHPSRVPSRPNSTTGGVSPLVPQDAAAFYTSNSYEQDISPIEGSGERKPSIGGNYFPLVTSAISAVPGFPPSQSLDPDLDLPSAPSEPTLPHAPSTFATDPMPPTQAPVIPQQPNPQEHFIPPPPPSQQPAFPPNLAAQSAPHQQLPTAPGPPHVMNVPHHASLSSQEDVARALKPHARSQPPPTHNVVYAPPTNHPYAPPPIVQPVIQPPVQADAIVDEEAVMKAQKHARWAISALNFEDIPTAIRELQGALSVLGAR